MQVCTSLQTDNHASTPLLSFLQAGCPSCRPTNSVKALKANNNYITRQISYKRFFSGYILDGCVLQFLLEHGHFLNIDISQGSVATRLRCGGIFKYSLLQIYH